MSKFHTTITVNRRQLKANCTVEHQPSLYKIDEELTATIAKSIQEEIDAEILWNILKNDGWVKVEVSYYTDNNHAIDISEWLVKNIRHRYKRNRREFLFESQQDANWFKIRWL